MAASSNSQTQALVQIDLQNALPKLASGKVRDLYVIDEKTLLFVASDRISAFDVIMENGIPEKGALLTAMSVYWFTYLPTIIPNLRIHFLTTALPSTIPPSLHPTLAPRSITVRRLRILPLESIVRGYITGSGWLEYKRSGTVCGIPLPPNLIEGAKLPSPLWTPSTKAELGEHDENISPAKAREIVGEKYGREIERLSLEIYTAGAARAAEVGIILADTKFEFGVDEETGEIVLCDEVLTPDSSRFWPADTWEANLGGPQPSFDKQVLRDWLKAEGLKGKEGVSVSEEVVKKTTEKYREAFERISGEKWRGGA